jgi:hypothetical protein
MIMPDQSELGLRTIGDRGKDLFLCHTGADKPWVERLVERVEAEPYQNLPMLPEIAIRRH